MKIKTTVVLLGGLVAVCSASLKADDLDTAKHPINALHEHEVANDRVDVAKHKDELKEKKEQLEQAKKDYHTDLKEHGANSDVTKSAKVRLESLRKEYRELVQKQRDAAHQLQKDKQKVSEDRR